jgi:hypothetical protein
VDDKPYEDFDRAELTVKLPADNQQHRVRVKITPSTWLDTQK